MSVAALLLLGILAALSVFQAVLLCGAPFGRYAWGGRHRVLPLKFRIGSAIAIVIYGLVSLLVLDRGGVWASGVHDMVVTVGLWVAFAYFTLGIIMNALSKSKPERWVMVPVCIVLAVCSFFVATQDGVDAKQPPTYLFNHQAADGWWAGENNNPRTAVTEDYAGDEPIEKLPVAGRVIFQKPQGVDGCFVMYSYYDYVADVQALRKTKETGMVSNDGTTVRRLGALPVTMDTPEGSKQYQLHQYELTGPGSQTFMKGMSLGYVELDHGYISVAGVCSTAGELKDTVPAMESVSLAKLESVRLAK